jgi:hypothetical protein
VHSTFPVGPRLVAVVLLLGCGVRSGCAQTPVLPVPAHPDSLEPQQIAWAPDGQRLAFSANFHGNFELYTADANGSHLRRITDTDRNEIGVSWSSDGRFLAFDSHRGGMAQIYRANPDGSEVVQLTAMAFPAADPSWSPDGKRIVFMAKPAKTFQLFVMDADGDNVRRITDNAANDYNPQWSPDGRTIAFESDRDAGGVDEIYVVNPDGAGERRLTHNAVNDVFPTWSSDSRRILWVQVANRRATLLEMAADGSGARTVRANVAYGVYAADGVRIAMKMKDTATSLWHVVVGRADGPDVAIGLANSASPLDYLARAELREATDTLDTYMSRQGEPIQGGGTHFIVRTVAPVGRRWEMDDVWSDRTGANTTHQLAITGPGVLTTEMLRVRATTDSASLLITSDRVTGWVAPLGKPTMLVDGLPSSARHEIAVVLSAIARSPHAIGDAFVVPRYDLFGADPLQMRMDTLRVTRQTTLRRGASDAPVIVVKTTSGAEYWIDESTGRALAENGAAGPNATWWHIVRGVTPPQ